MSASPDCSRSRARTSSVRDSTSRESGALARLRTRVDVRFTCRVPSFRFTSSVMGMARPEQNSIAPAGPAESMAAVRCLMRVPAWRSAASPPRRPAASRFCLGERWGGRGAGRGQCGQEDQRRRAGSRGSRNPSPASAGPPADVAAGKPGRSGSRRRPAVSFLLPSSAGLPVLRPESSRAKPVHDPPLPLLHRIRSRPSRRDTRPDRERRRDVERPAVPGALRRGHLDPLLRGNPEGGEPRGPWKTGGRLERPGRSAVAAGRRTRLTELIEGPASRRWISASGSGSAPGRRSRPSCA